MFVALVLCETIYSIEERIKKNLKDGVEEFRKNGETQINCENRLTTYVGVLVDDEKNNKENQIIRDADYEVLKERLRRFLHEEITRIYHQYANVHQSTTTTSRSTKLEFRPAMPVTSSPTPNTGTSTGSVDDIDLCDLFESMYTYIRNTM